MPRNAQIALRDLNIREGKPRDYRKKGDATSVPILSPVRKPAHEVPRKGTAGAAKRWEVKQLRWQGLQLFSLLLAYLQYYFVGVYLQIASLPTAHITTAGQTLFT